MDPPVTRYLPRDGHNLAYGVVGTGPSDVVWFFEVQMHLDLLWTDPYMHSLFERVTTYSRAVYFQRRGFGLSDPIDHVPTIEQQAEDVLAVMDAEQIRHATLVGIHSTCGAQVLVAATAPERVDALMLIAPCCEPLLDADRPPHGWTEAEANEAVELWRDAVRHWGEGYTVALTDSHIDSPYNRRLMAMLERCSASPSTMSAHLEASMRIDYSYALRSVQCPTKVVLISGGSIPVGPARYLADLLPHGELVITRPSPRGAALGEAWAQVQTIVEELVRGSVPPAEARRRFAATLFTDIVGSTKLLARIGDTSYRALLERHERDIRFAVAEAGGQLMSTVGDGTFSLFDGPVAAVQCAARIIDDARRLGFEVRAGVHAGPVEPTGTDVTGLTVHVGARIGAAARPGEVLVSRHVRELAGGSGLQFADRGTRRLAGVPGRIQLFVLTGGQSTLHAPRKRAALNVFDRAFLGMARRTPGMLRSAAAYANTRQRRSAD
ncbi:adenylate/guanylate cyclase domain-containing protein [Rhodococcus sp. NPDC047139]|uniref:adenylate/guanylate cyclase domain-containing protein n=1 Tax=Rhodococcus sp. NPDC047139 TaxID=3155141 RepID=UPI0033E96DE6